MNAFVEKPKRGPGRPPLPAGEKLAGKHTSITFTAEQEAALAALFPAHTQSDRVRMAIDGYLLFRRAGFLVERTYRWSLNDHD